jgi:hypothetical protein
MTVEVIQDALVLLPNREHENFTITEQKILKGTILNGKEIQIQGKRRGEPFTYRLFQTNNRQLIHLNKIKPMTTTEITLGADAAPSATKVNLPSVSNIGIRPILGTIVGLGLAYFYSKKQGFEGNKKYIHWAIGGVAGFAVGKYLQSKRDVTVKPSK